MKKKLIKINLFIICIILAVFFILFILGRFERIGYLSDISLNVEETLKNNSLYTNDLEINDIKEYIFTNNMLTNYVYNFRINYYSKVFRNSDIYGVYLNINSLPNYIKEIKMNEDDGTPFGTLVSYNKLEDEKIDNIKYILRVKYTIFVIIILLISLLLVLIYKFRFIILDFISLIYHIKLFRNRYLYTLIIFLCFLIMPNIIYKIFYDKFDHTNYENRVLSSKPIIDINNLDTYPKLYENYFYDYIPFRNELIQLKNIIDIKIFQNIISDRVILGKDNWLLFKDYHFNAINKYIGLDCSYYTDEELDLVKNNLLNFRNELKKSNIDFILMICPDKEIIYSEYMPNYIKRKRTLTSTDQFIKYMENTDIKIVYPKEELIKYKDKYQLYYKYDTHWNNLGGYIGYSEFMKKININVIPLSNLMILNSGKISGDLAIMANSVKLFSDDNTYMISNYNIKNYSILKGDKHFNSVTISDNNRNKNILFIRDSFLIAMYDYMASYFYKSFIIHRNHINNNDDIINDKPDIVVFETVERDLKNFLFNIVPNTTIIEKINKNLETNSVVTNN
ncbi:hypothetical protein BRSU_1807 [Brachyspira suanatina]|uniref:AlgX/AlgJ SGNH hydrolase-like domain-containing protein n=1 Tax=Brachyspira suanatina TaxID=381802 RepID=A0A0G4K7Z8_9SPIR|nr:DHHW family protein [Brachyspira suanatina]CRF33999.1 hypothetical protein BRSU_1807 [Brachyspira suanatina]